MDVYEVFSKPPLLLYIQANMDVYGVLGEPPGLLYI